MNATATSSSNVSSQTKKTTIDCINAILSDYARAHGNKSDRRDEFLIAANLIQTAQKVFTDAGAKTAELQQAVAQSFMPLGELPWGDIHFPVAQTLLSQTYSDVFTRNQVSDADKYRILLESLYTFLILVEGNPDLAREDLLRSIVEDGATHAQVAKAPEINYRANVLNIFSPNKVAAIDLEPLQVVIYRGELIGGGFGPELWGLAYVAGEEAHVLLETGEYVMLPSASLCLAVTKDYDTSELPPYLLACAKLFVPSMLVKAMGGPEAITVAKKLGKIFGSFSKEIPCVELHKTEIEACENVLDAHRWGRHDIADQGAMKTFSIAPTDLQIIVTAQQSRIRPYITATLVHAGSGTIHMRLDVPREFSATGIYFFPLGDKSAALMLL